MVDDIFWKSFHWKSQVPRIDENNYNKYPLKYKTKFTREPKPLSQKPRGNWKQIAEWVMNVLRGFSDAKVRAGWWEGRPYIPEWARIRENKEQWASQSKPHGTLAGGISNACISGKQKMFPKWSSKTHEKWLAKN